MNTTICTCPDIHVCPDCWNADTHPFTCRRCNTTSEQINEGRMLELFREDFTHPDCTEHGDRR